MPRKKLYILYGLAINLIALIAIVFMHGYLVGESTEKYISILMKDYRREIVGGNRNSVLMKLGSKLGEELGLLEIGFDIPGNRRKYVKKDFREAEADSYIDKFTVGTIQYDFYYDESKQEKALALIFYYSRFDKIGSSLFLWITFCLFSSLAWCHFYRSNIRYELVIKKSEKANILALIAQSLSHDMRAPLGIFERLLSKNFGESFEQHKVEVRESLHRLYAMVESLRHSESELLVERSVHLHDFQFGMKSLSGKASSRNIKMTLNVTGPIVIRADQAKLERAWTNLLSNAVEAAKSRVKFEVLIHDRNLLLLVVDDGPGVSDEFLPKLFQRGATYGKPDGTGLGLAYVRQIMRAHGGDVTYRREDNLTIFECRLPNAVHPEKEQVVENSASLETQLVQKLVQSVAICLEPNSLTRSVLAKLASYDSSDFFFTEERNLASIVVSNIDDVMFEVLERDDQEYVAVAHLKCDEVAIMKILKRKFNLDVEGDRYV